MGNRELQNYKLDGLARVRRPASTWALAEARSTS